MVGPYRLRVRVGAARGVETYAAHKHPSGEAVRVDRVDPRLTARRDEAERLVEAARFATQILHPNVVQLREIARGPDAYYLIHEAVAGRSLEELLATVDPDQGLPLWLVLHLTAEILSGLVAVHARDVAHGALDASAIILTDRGEVKLDGALMRVAVQPHRLLPVPEGAISQQADVFRVGVVLFQLLTGRDPFDGGASPASLAMMRSSVRVSPALYVPGLPPEIDALALSFLAADPEARPRTALAALADVMAVAGEAGWTCTPAEVARALALYVEAPAARSSGDRGSTPRSRIASYVGRALPAGAAACSLVPLIPRADVQWDSTTGDFAQVFVPPRPSVLKSLEPEPLLVMSLADGRVERAFDLQQVVHLWSQDEARPRLVARPGTTWRDADDFAALAGIDAAQETSAPLKIVTHVGDLASTSLLALLADLARARATGSLMIMDPAEPRTSRRTVVLVEGVIAHVGSNHPAHQGPDWLVRSGYVDAAEIAPLFREVIRSGRSLVDLVAQRRREAPSRLWAKAWTEKLSDPLCTRRGRFAFDAAAVSRPVPPMAPTAAALLIDAARRSKTPEELRQWAAPRRATRYALGADFGAWTQALALDERLTTLARELAEHATLDDTIRRMPGDAGAIVLLAYLFHETRALSFGG